jgi:ADP-heptose:LPS heptosyltransferase
MRNSVADVGRAKEHQRPWLTKACERLVNCWFSSPREPLNIPLPAVPHRLLVVKVFGLGDSILVRSVIEHLIVRNPKMDVGVLVGPATREIMTLGARFKIHQYNAKSLTIRTAFESLLEIRRCGYDAILNFEQLSTAGAVFLAATGIPLRVGFLPTIASPKSRFLTHAQRFRQECSMWESFVCLGQMIDSSLPDDLMPVPLKCSPESEVWAEQWLAHRSAGPRPVVMHLGSQGLEFRRWPVSRFVELGERLRGWSVSSIILTGTAPERPLIREFMENYSGHSIDASDFGSLEKTAALLKRCAVLVSNDTGIMHLGAAMGMPTVGLFGPNSPHHWSPIGSQATYVYETKEPCSPCLNLYAGRWPLKCTNPEQGRCMLDIGVDSVLNAARRVITGEWLGTLN